ncbi:MAG: ferritin-like domain-containing protein [Parachlamydiaceae bacterium]|nr:ferritin-like domain-containing protein [Parachlamydiaceae bacterium]
MEKGVRDLLIDELNDILNAEEQIVEALPEMVKAAQSSELKDAFENHLNETKGQIQRLTKIYKLLKVEPEEKLCKATKGLILECKEVIKEFDKSTVRDAALISKAQRIEHYEISAYGTMRTFAHELDLEEVAGLLQETLDEEGNADKKLTDIAMGGLTNSGINEKAVIPNDFMENGSKDKIRKEKTSSNSSAKEDGKHRKVSAGQQKEKSKR